MQGSEIINKIVLMAGAFAAVIILFYHLFTGSDLLHASFMAACVMFAVSLILLVCLKSIVRILYSFLEEQGGDVSENEEKSTGVSNSS